MSSKNQNIKTLAGIVSFNPDVYRLKENVAAISPQVDKVIVVDNGSQNINLVKKSLTGFKNLKVIEFGKNLGIADALAYEMDYADKNGFDWFLSLDDDSVALPGLIDEYKKYVDLPKVATMTCFMEDRNYNRNEEKIDKDYIFVDRCITSGCFMSVDAYKNSDGYDTDFFIDRVDDDICYNLTTHGFKHIKVNFVGLLHEMGYGGERKFLWHTARALNYSPIRRYYIFRNETIIRNKYPNLIKKEWLESGRPMWVNFALSTLKILLYEDNKLEKIKASKTGWHDGKIYVKLHLR